MVSRLLLALGAIALLDRAGDAFLLTLVATSQNQIASVISAAVFFLIGVAALFVAFRTRLFSNYWLAVAGAVGLINVIVAELMTSCRDIKADDLSYRAYYCSNSEMKWLVAAICFVFLVVFVRKRAPNSTSGLRK
jgi:hypothetical protein